MRRAQVLDQLAGGRDAHALRGHDRDVVALGELHLLEERQRTLPSR